MCICKRLIKGDCEEIFSGDLALKDSGYSGNMFIGEETGKGEIIINAWIGSVDLFSEKLEINYCPFCGSKLTKD